MKISITKQRINFGAILIGTAFFLVNGFALFIYDIDVSPLFLALLLFIYMKSVRRIRGMPSYIDLAILGTVAVLFSVISAKFFIPPDFQIDSRGYAIPAIGFAILVTLLFDNLELSLLFSLFVCFLGGNIDGDNFKVGMSLLSGSLVGSMLSFRVPGRSQVIRAGALAGIVQFLMAFILVKGVHIAEVNFTDSNLLMVCLLNGIGSAIFVIGTLAIFENLFKVVTNISLQELSIANHPIMRRLILEAPGTYQHSLMVANWSEAAAEAIGANSLLARVGAYYHDIGKVNKPNYFVENQMVYKDAHKDLKPSMSKLIIMNHVKEGAELARKYRVNPRVIDFILQHHGRTLVYYFYRRARTLEPEEDHNEEEYRYPGPKPQSKEIAIVALADTIEALSRTLEEPTPSRINEMVLELVKKRFMEGELDESDLTLKDLEKITQTFIRMLNAFFHARINYPKDDSREKEGK